MTVICSAKTRKSAELMRCLDAGDRRRIEARSTGASGHRMDASDARREPLRSPESAASTTTTSAVRACAPRREERSSQAALEHVRANVSYRRPPRLASAPEWTRAEKGARPALLSGEVADEARELRGL